jgi:DNA invertase Pin-like site-specific DNA recombinase
MALIGYSRVSSKDQDCAIQEAALVAAGCTMVRSEKRSGTSTKGRDELALTLEILRPGDTLVVTRIDRLARSVHDLEQIVRQLRDRGIDLRATEQPVDTSSPEGRAFLQMLGVFAEFETAIRKERQLEGIAKAKAEGVYKGRPAKLKATEVQQALAAGEKPAHVARRLGISRNSVYRLKAAGGEAD